MFPILYANDHVCVQQWKPRNSMTNTVGTKT